MSRIRLVFALVLGLMLAAQCFATDWQFMGFDEVQQKMVAVVRSDQPFTVNVTFDQSNPAGWIGGYDSYSQGSTEFRIEAPLSPDDPNRLEFIPDGESNIISSSADFFDSNGDYMYTLVTRDTLVANVDGSGNYYTYSQPGCDWVLPDTIRIPTAFCATVCHGTRSVPIYCETPMYNVWGPDSIEVTVTNGCIPQPFDTLNPADPNYGHACNVECTPVDWSLFSWVKRIFPPPAPPCTIYLSMTYCGYGPGCVCIWRSDHYLPVEITSFSAIPGDGRVTLNWASASENNLSKYRISRSTNPNDQFSFVGTVNAHNDAHGATYSFVDESALNGTTYYYKLHEEDMNGELHVYGVTVSAAPQAGLVSEYKLAQNYPNPFNSQTSFNFSIVANDHVSLKVYDLLGQEVATVLDRDMQAGEHTINWNANGLATGVYVYKLTSGQFSDTKKLLFLK